MRPLRVLGCLLVLGACDSFSEANESSRDFSASSPPGSGGGVSVGGSISIGAGGGSVAIATVELDSIDPAFEPGSGCDVERLREAALARMKRTVDSAFVTYTSVCFPTYYVENYLTIDGGSGVVVERPPELPSLAPREYTGTNNQVEAVEEPDFVKTDGQYFYVTTGTSLRIFDTWPPEQASELSDLILPGPTYELLLDGDRVVAFSRSFRGAPGTYAQKLESHLAAQCTYGFDCDVRSDGSETTVTVIDVGDRSQPAAVRQLEVSGSLITARRVGGAVHALFDSGATLPEFAFVPEALANFDPALGPELACDPELRFSQVEELFRSLHDENVRLIEEASASDLAPQVTEDGRRIELCDELYVPRAALPSDELGEPRYLSLLSFSTDDDAPPNVTTLASRPGFAYASHDAFYVAARGLVGDAFADVTLVHRLDLSGADSSYAASGVVKGRVLNQFSMDELEGVLRVATSTSYAPQPDAHTTVTTLVRNSDVLERRGQLDGLAPSEDMRAVRFQGNRAFLVTFKKTDPLFVIGLDDPAAPALLGELHIPGFSTYLHSMDEQHLLALGYDADDQGDFAWFTGIQLQIFDVADLGRPELLHRQVLGTRGTSSEALTHHLAFTYQPSSGLLSLPLSLCEGEDPFAASLTFSGLILYQADVEGLTELGRIAHEEPGPTPAGATCTSWWTQASSAVKRSFIVDGYVFSVTSTELRATALDDLTQTVASLPLQ